MLSAEAKVLERGGESEAHDIVATVGTGTTCYGNVPMIQLLHYSLTIPYGKTLLPQTRPEPVQTALSSAPRLPSLPGSGSAGPIPPQDPQAFESLQIYPDPDIMFRGHLLICIDMLTVAICDMRLQMCDLYCRSPKASAVEPVARMRSPGKVPERPLRSLKRLYLL